MQFKETNFWQLIEDIWAQFTESNQVRIEITQEGGTPKLLKKANQALNELVMPQIEEKLRSFSKQDLILFDQILERKLYDLDREDVHEYIEGGDDGFLYNRSLVVGLGQTYYNQININPFNATNDKFSWYVAGIFGSQTMCFIAQNTYRELFNETMPETNISRESYSNIAGWPEDF